MKKRAFHTFRTVLDGVRIPYFLMLVSIVSSFLIANAMVETAVITAAVVDAYGNLRTSMLVKYILVSLATAGLSVCGTFCNNLMSERINIGVRTKLWKKMLRLPMSYYDRESGEQLVSRITVDCNRASAFIGVVIMTVSSLYGLYLALRSMWNFSSVLTLWSALLLPVVASGVALCGKLVFRSNRDFHSRHAESSAYILERVRNFRLVRTGNMEKKEAEEGSCHYRALFRASAKALFSEMLMSSFMGITPVALIIITFIVGGILTSRGELSVGKVIGFYSISSMASIRISTLITVYGDLVAANGIFDKIASILESDEEKDTGRPMDLPDGDITLEDVRFSYDGEREVLKGVTCTIPAHRITAIIGDNGAGKSTLFKLLERIYEPSGGRICFSGKDIASFSLRSWRSAFALVSQDRPLLSGTVRDNITYGRERAVEEREVENAAEKTGIASFIRTLPSAYDEKVEAGGGNFSGGQRQCIAIARAIMRNPDYLLLDEATSNLDMESEREVTEALAALMEGRTTVMIAHSLSAISHADHIIVLSDGVVEAEGTPEEVALTSRVFREFVKAHSAREED